MCKLGIFSGDSYHILSLSMRVTAELVPGILVKKYRRFLVDVRLQDGSIVTAHSPTMARLKGCNTPGLAVLISDSENPQRRHRYSWEFVQINGTWVSINAAVPAKIVQEALEAGTIPALSGFTEIERDARYGRGKRVSFLLHGMEDNCFLNVYTVTWVKDGIAMFPDVASVRVRNSIRHLTEIVGRGHRAAAFFIVQRDDCTMFAPAADIDPDLPRILQEAKRSGVILLSYTARVSPEEITLGRALPFHLDARQ
jgi:sugar fermentation stimulation protein A